LFTIVDHKKIADMYSFLLIHHHSCMQAWKLKEENRLLDLVDSELSEYDESEVYRFLLVALFCTQSAAQHRPSMKQVLEMLSKKVHLNENALTEPGIYRWHSTGKKGGSLNETSSQAIKYRKTENPHEAASTLVSGTDIVTEMLPRWWWLRT